MKILVAFFFCTISSFAFCQAQDSLGIDNNKTLNQQEALFLNNALENNRGDFDFNNKKIAFITGSSGNTIVPKKEYFEKYAKPSDDRRVARNMFMVVLTKEEKTTSGGYDALVFTWVKVAFSNKQKQKIIEQLKKEDSVSN